MRVFSTGWSDGFDGPGQRWVVYLKGCNFRCPWCANPEGLSAEPEILFYAARGRYAHQACPFGAVAQRDGAPTLDRRVCAACRQRPCITQWHHPAFDYAGEEMSVAEIVDRARRYRPFWADGGGVTFGGGEPTLQAEPLAEAVEALRREGIHTAIETNAGSPSLGRFVGRADLLICDLKCVSRNLHLRWTGCGNETVLKNLRLAAAEQPELWVRVPLVSGVNDSDDEMGRIVAFLAGLPRRRTPLRVDVLRMHHLGEPKYNALGMPYSMAGVSPPPVAAAEALAERLAHAGLAAAMGG
jgi:pyruvate formate lyase activating enzyme